MKNIIFYIIFFVVIIQITQVQAQNFSVFFYGPTAAMQANFTGASAAYVFPDSCAGQPTGFSYVKLDAVTTPKFRNVAPPNIKATFDSLMNGSSAMRQRILKLAGLSNGLVTNLQIHLYDDRTGLPAADVCTCDSPIGGVRAVWPCADNSKNPKTGSYFGDLWLGEMAAKLFVNAASIGGYWSWFQTVVHEFSHTQFAKQYDASGKPVANKLGYYGVGLSYNEDNSHWGEEILGTPQSSLDEGLATFWGSDKNTKDRNNIIAFLNNKTARFYLGSHSVLAGTREMWNAPHEVIFSGTIPANKTVTPDPAKWNYGPITLTSPNITPGASGYELRAYKWLDVPGEFIFYNENMFQGFAVLFHEYAYANKDTAFNKILDAAKKMTLPYERLRYPAFLTNHLANGMEVYARSTAGQRDASAGTLTSSMFAYALFDIVTHFGMSDAALKREFEIQTYSSSPSPSPKPKAFDQYWAHRNAVKQLVCPFLGGNNCQPATGDIDIRKAVETARNYFRDPSRILK